MFVTAAFGVSSECAASCRAALTQDSGTKSLQLTAGIMRIVQHSSGGRPAYVSAVVTLHHLNDVAQTLCKYASLLSQAAAG